MWSSLACRYSINMDALTPSCRDSCGLEERPLVLVFNDTGEIFHTGFYYQYLPDPVITDIYPRESIQRSVVHLYAAPVSLKILKVEMKSSVILSYFLKIFFWAINPKVNLNMEKDNTYNMS